MKRMGKTEPERAKQYHVLIAEMTEIGGKEVTKQGSARVVKLTPAQAQYWLDQGAISESSGEAKPGAALGKVKRLSVLGNDGEISISQYQFQTVDWTIQSKARMRVRYGTPFSYCSNTAYWDDLTGTGGTVVDLVYDPIKNIFIRPITHETFQILSAIEDFPGHWVYRLQQYWIDEMEDYYLDRVVTTESFAGAIVAETFLNVQDGWLTSIDLFFTRIAGDGDVQVFVVETEHGAPEFDRALVRVTLSPSDLNQYPAETKVRMVRPFCNRASVTGSSSRPRATIIWRSSATTNTAKGCCFRRPGPCSRWAT